MLENSRCIASRARFLGEFTELDNLRQVSVLTADGGG